MDNGQYHYQAPSPNDPPDRDINTFRCETNAYRRLKAKGFCKRDVIPDFYDANLWLEDDIFTDKYSTMSDSVNLDDEVVFNSDDQLGHTIVNEIEYDQFEGSEAN